MIRLHFPASNNVAEYEALVNGMRITVELGVRRLDARGDSQLIIDQVMKNSHCRDRKLEAYCDEVRHLEDKFHGLELNHVARWYNETVDELAKIASGRTTVPPNVFSRDIYQPSVKLNDAPEPDETSAQPEVPSAAEDEALRVEGERNGVTPNSNWQTPYLEYLLRGELPLDKVEARRLARRAKSFVLLGDEKELYHRSPSGILHRCISVSKGQELLQELHSGACGHHAAPRALVGNIFRQGFYWPTTVADTTRIVRSCQGCQFYARQTHMPAQALQTIPITWSFAVWGLDLVGPLQKAPGGLLAPAGRHRQILQVDRGPTLNQHQVRAGNCILHKHHPLLWGPELHHHRQWHTVHWEEVPGLLRKPPHPCGLGRRSSPHDEWAGGACQRCDFAGTKTKDLQRPQQVWQAMDERATLGGLESEDDAEPVHEFLAVLSSLWGRGCLTHRLRIRFPEDKGVRRSKQPDQPRRFIGPAGRGSRRGLTTLGTISAVSATLPRPNGSAPRPPGGRLGTSAPRRRPRAPQAYSSLGRVVYHRQDFEAQNIQAGQRSRRDLPQRLEHPTATSLLPLKCFKSFIYLVFFTYTNKV
jgi:hypothetical protein